MNSNKKIYAGLACTVAAVAVAVFVWNQSRMEIYYLCGNFGPGVSRESVIRQLQTGQFLRFEKQTRPSGQRIVVDSAITLSLYRCIVELDEAQKVTRGEYHSWRDRD